MDVAEKKNMKIIFSTSHLLIDLISIDRFFAVHRVYFPKNQKHKFTQDSKLIQCKAIFVSCFDIILLHSDKNNGGINSQLVICPKFKCLEL